MQNINAIGSQIGQIGTQISEMQIGQIGSKIGLNNAAYFETNNSKLGEVKQQLDSMNDKDKLEGMKRLIAMMSKGKDVSSMFPDVVKNVVAKNLEVKKLVYMYLVHYAELEPDAALLAINSFQKAMSDQNQLIRASALRVMSSIRVVDIVQLIVLAIEKAVKDSSPYVRKAAAHAIAKVYRLDPEKKEHLTNIISTLLGDNSTMVLGSAIAAFTEVCPEEYELIHPHYRKLCKLLADVDEWGQVFIINMMTRYARTHFVCPDPLLLDPAKQKDSTKKRSFYGSDQEDENGDDDDEDGKEKEELAEMDQDHRFLLRSTLPLLQSRNNAVVMAVSSLYFYVAPPLEASKVGKALVRVLRANREVQYVVLTNIATMACIRPALFEPQLAEFFVSSSDPEFVRNLKLEILTSIANEGNISRILREFKEYVKSEDKIFVIATIQAIGRCASTIPEVTESCMHGLMALVSNPAEVVVAESVIVIKSLLQKMANPTTSLPSETSSASAQKHHRNVVRQLSKLFERITVPAARASILWVIGEYCDRIPLIAPDVLRNLAKTFADEDDQVKLQGLNLGAKLFFLNQDQTGAIFQYILTLAKFDQSYDIRDRARMMRVLLINKDGRANSLHEGSKGVVVNQKPTPVVTSASEDRQRFIFGSLSHIVNHTTSNYQPLPDFPEVAPDPSVRAGKDESKWDSPAVSGKEKEKWWDRERSGGDKDKAFYSDDDDSRSDRSDYDDYSDDDDLSGSGSDGGNRRSRRSRRRDDSDESRSRSRSRSNSQSRSQSRSRSRSNSRSKSPDSNKKRANYDDFSDDADSRSDHSDHSDDYSSEEEDRGRNKNSKPSPPTKSTTTTGKASSAPSKPGSTTTAKSTAKSAASTTKPGSSKAAAPSKSSSNDLDDLFDLGPAPSSASNDLAGLNLSSPILSPSTSSFSPLSFSGSSMPLVALTSSQTRKVLLKQVMGNGLEVEYSFLRKSSPSTFGTTTKLTNTIQLVFKNHTLDKTFNAIQIAKLSLQGGSELSPFPEITSLSPGGLSEQLISVHFASASVPIKFEISTDRGSYPVTISPSIGELIRPNAISAEEFSADQKRLSGMNESSEPISIGSGPEAIRNVPQKVLEAVYLSPVSLSPENGNFKFAGISLLDEQIVLVTVEVDVTTARGKCVVNCENSLFAATLLRKLVQLLVE